ncbi:hypothetical protein [Zavarzinella formosa]|uniref:hypothetical protein n=1 Tax=Zavarzinella formosa TaxID=360055 RepID=UPI0002E4E8C9|nr:hypothetical protein [Zavarzinella formosa]
MRFSQWMLFGVLASGVFVVGCNPPAADTKPVAKKDDHGDHDHDDHDHGEGPHGGTILEFGKYHGEFTVDHKTKEATVYILSGNLKKAVPLDVEKLTLSIKKPMFQVDLLPKPAKDDPKGSSSVFVAKHDNFGVEQEFEGTVSGEVAGKPYVGEFKEKAHDHEHEKKK